MAENIKTFNRNCSGKKSPETSRVKTPEILLPPELKNMSISTCPNRAVLTSVGKEGIQDCGEKKLQETCLREKTPEISISPERKDVYLTTSPCEADETFHTGGRNESMLQNYSEREKTPEVNISPDRKNKPIFTLVSVK